ncbi:MAG TPA: MFS transporter [Jatrophihabitans sp.]|jgi:MFS family permease|uniref:MFS transporter n=1 Tax=Jatrophihabitans sp. TaxID=1932789 RepID=UPI002EEDF9AB
MTATADAGRPAGLWRHGNFLKLWTAQTISLVGTQITALALPLTAILKLDASPLQIGLIGTMQFLPFLLVTLPAGAIIDRLPQLPVMVSTDVARAALLMAVPVAAWLDYLSLALLYPVAFTVGVLSVFNEVTQQSYLPAIIEPDQLVEGNTKLQLSYSGALFAGPGIGGVLVQVLTAPIAILVDAFSYLGSAVLLLLIRREDGQPAPEAPPGRTDLRGLGRDIMEGIRFVWRHRLIRPLALATGTANFFYLFGMTGAILALYAIRVLHLSPALLGAVLAVGNLGAILGSLVADRVLQRWRFGRVMILGSMISAVAIVMMALANPSTALVMLAVGVLIGEFGACIYDIAQISLRQAATPAPLLGRMNATVRFLNWGPIPLGAFVGGLLGETIGLRPTLWVAAVGSLLPAIPLILSRIRSMHDLPSGPEHSLETLTPTESATGPAIRVQPGE